MHPVELANVVDGAEVGVIESRRGTSLAVEAANGLRTVLRREMRYLERHATIELSILREVNNSHPALADLLEDVIASESLGQAQGGRDRLRWGRRDTRGLATS